MIDAIDWHFWNYYLFQPIVNISFCLGIIKGLISWSLGSPKNGGYLKVYTDIWNAKRLRVGAKIIITILIFVPHTIIYFTYFIVSLKVIPFLLFKDKTFL